MKAEDWLVILVGGGVVWLLYKYGFFDVPVSSRQAIEKFIKEFNRHKKEQGLSDGEISDVTLEDFLKEHKRRIRRGSK